MQDLAAQLELDLSAMKGQGWNAGTGRGRDKDARLAAGRRWYNRNPEIYTERNRRQRQARIAWMRERKNRPCLDCGLSYPWYVMEFDHRPGEVKLFTIGNAVRSMVALSKLLAEIDKCDLVCANCHRLRTAQRGGWDDAELLKLGVDT